ncbi:MutL-like protein 1, colon cancer, nonpolyposis type 2 [Basidiobolus meristosporus CBS 931.73]|uniref:MutL-like protein 1, colon cancer, nonpolyposis type 2 n=1 Tax=Basidiobolus meristosporus CBS 931.73 TaxID=1314790 RepID=A0A1Y1Z1B5_9FUNG|nr:MutL-like protein 1, colon cancer, nonpolyposis type 2 [Basidiobolus meristosporus CBS 931.73]|eukprot:ORY04078.1 MutL-like protein 1, colon cancer, nonpolyposis type 2 [Basidiobolus meristosporus CBS 931.73]
MTAQSPRESNLPRPIKKLDEAVVNRIAAGEIIHRPANALKELIENSLDAGSTSISVLIKEGGLKLLQIQDTGHGIRKEDMGIVCERFTTSKLKDYDDLMSIGTYGFRGEALASISHVAHLTITTKTQDSSCAYRACYSDGKLTAPKPGASADPKPCAGNNGTQITVEDLFYNVPTRRKALKNANEEYNKILDVVSRYAVHNPGVSFTCKKQGTNRADVHTSSTASVVDNIRQIYGNSVASDLLELKYKSDNLEFEVDGWVSNANYNAKKMTMLLFINHRAVENISIKRAVESIYSSYLPKGAHPYLYISISMKPLNVDVNVHPTKREVHFLNEEEVVEEIAQALQARLADANSSRTFLAQTVLTNDKDVGILTTKPTDTQEQSTSKASTPAKVHEYKLVRTDSRARTLEHFYDLSQSGSKKIRTSENSDVSNSPAATPKPSRLIPTESSSTSKENSNRMEVDKPDDAPVRTHVEEQPVEEEEIASTKQVRVEVRLTSVLELREEIQEQGHHGLTQLFGNHTFVGVVDDSLALIQHQTKLYLVNYQTISEELFYQLVLKEFCNFGKIVLSSPAPIAKLLMVALEEERKYGLEPDIKPNQEIVEPIVDLLVSRRDMLLEYFAMDINEKGMLTKLPLIIKGYAPNLDKLPMFLLRLGTEVDWESEKGCFSSLARELAIFYSTEAPALVEGEKQKNKAAKERFRWEVEHLIFPTVKGHLVPPSSLTEGNCVVQVADLPELYRIFERC